MTETRRAWQGGPLRQYAGNSPRSYVCENCQQTTVGVYYVASKALKTAKKWLCAACRELLK